MLLKMFKTAFRIKSKRSAEVSRSINPATNILVGLEPEITPLAGRRLHIGGHIVQANWEIFDAQSRDGVIHVGDASNLSRFPNETFAAVYASHVLEHFDYCRVGAVLREWARVLIPRGLLYVSVPDLDVLSAIILDKQSSTLQQRSDAIRMLFGGQTDQWDYHKAALNEEVLTHFLKQAGLNRVHRVKNFEFFPDTSTLVFLKKQISLNVIAFKS